MDQETEEEGGKNRLRKFKSLNDKMFSLEGIWEQPPNPQIPGADEGRAPAPLPGPQGPAICFATCLPRWGGAGKHPSIHPTDTHSGLPPARLTGTRSLGERRAQGQSQGEAQTSSGEPKPEQPAMSWEGQAPAGQGRARFMERDGPATLLLHAWGGLGAGRGGGAHLCFLSACRTWGS